MPSLEKWACKSSSKGNTSTFVFRTTLYEPGWTFRKYRSTVKFSPENRAKKFSPFIIPYTEKEISTIEVTSPIQNSVKVTGSYTDLKVSAVRGGVRVTEGTRQFTHFSFCSPIIDPPNLDGGNASGGSGGSGGGGGGGSTCSSTRENNYCAGVASLIDPSLVVSQGTLGLVAQESVNDQSEGLKEPEIQLGQWQGQSWKEQG